MALIFAYGTLKRGFPNDSLMGDATGIPSLTEDNNYDMISFGNFPAMILGGKSLILGEVYKVSPQRLKFLDIFEDPRAYYRVRIRIQGIEDLVWSYCLNPDIRGLVPEEIGENSGVFSGFHGGVSIKSWIGQK